MRLIILKSSLFAVLLYVLLPSTSCQLVDTDDDDDDVDARIVGGHPANAGEAPYQLGVFKEGRFICGATLILAPTTGEQVVITASHCVTKPGSDKQVSARELSFVGGTLTVNSGGERRNAKKVIRHEKYHDVVYNDIAIVFLDHPFDLSPNLQPIHIPVNEHDGATNALTVSGWGTLSEDGPVSPTLQIVEVPVINNDVCAQWYRETHSSQVIFDTTICAGKDIGGQDACKGDSGGPAVGQDQQGPFLAGVVSWGDGCAQGHRPGVYTRVSKFAKWIIEQTEINGGKGHHSSGNGFLPLGPSQPANPYGSYGPSQPANPYGSYGPSQPANPYGSHGPSQPANPYGSYGPSQPANPYGSYGPSQPANPYGSWGPSHPANPYGSWGPSQVPANPYAPWEQGYTPVDPYPAWQPWGR